MRDRSHPSISTITRLPTNKWNAVAQANGVPTSANTVHGYKTSTAPVAQIDRVRFIGSPKSLSLDTIHCQFSNSGLAVYLVKLLFRSK